MPVITSRIIAEKYGVLVGESMNVHDVEPGLSEEWSTPELQPLCYNETSHATITVMFGADATDGLPGDTVEKGT